MIIRFIEHKKILYKIILCKESVKLFDQNIWCLSRSNKNFYIRRCTKNNKLIYFHRKLKNFPHCLVDHKNGNTLDCRLKNLRLANKSQNTTNQFRKRKNNTSGFTGIHQTKDLKWRAEVWYMYKKYGVGTFNTAEEAAKARDKVAKKLHKEFASLNYATN